MLEYYDDDGKKTQKLSEIKVFAVIATGNDQQETKRGIAYKFNEMTVAKVVNFNVFFKTSNFLTDGFKKCFFL